MKTRSLDMALGRESVEVRASHAMGLVSRITVSSDGGGPVGGSVLACRPLD